MIGCKGWETCYSKGRARLHNSGTPPRWVWKSCQRKVKRCRRNWQYSTQNTFRRSNRSRNLRGEIFNRTGIDWYNIWLPTWNQSWQMSKWKAICWGIQIKLANQPMKLQHNQHKTLWDKEGKVRKFFCFRASMNRKLTHPYTFITPPSRYFIPLLPHFALPGGKELICRLGLAPPHHLST